MTTFTFSKSLLSRKTCQIEADLKRLADKRMIRDPELKSGIPAFRSAPSQFIDELDELPFSTMWRAIATRSGMQEKMNAYLDKELARRPLSDIYSKHAWKLVTNAVFEQFSEAVKPFSFSQVSKLIPQSSSPGLPYNLCGITKKSDAIPFVMKRVTDVCHKLKRNQFSYKNFPPCKAGARNSLCPKGTNKPRLTWVYPIEVTMFEGRFLLPLMQVFKTWKYAAWSWNWLDGWGTYLQAVTNNHFMKVGLDYSGFDSTPTSDEIKMVFKILAQCLDMNREEKKQFGLVRDYFINTPIYFYDTLIRKRSGVPSGSFFTQIVDTILNMYWTTAAMLHSYHMQGRYPTTFQSMEQMYHFACFLGDDAYLVTFHGYSPSEILLPACSYLSQHAITVNATKSWCTNMNLAEDSEFGFSPNFTFLGKKITSSDIYVSPEAVLSQILYPEDQDKCPGDVLTRAIGVAWMLGTHKPSYDVAHTIFRYVKRTYNCDPTPFPREIATLFEFVLGLEVPELVFPSHETLLARYFNSFETHSLNGDLWI